MRNVLIIVGGVIVLIIIVLLVSRGGPRDGQAPTATPFEELARLEFTDYGGRRVTLADFPGQPLVVNSWAAWCPFCVKELPDFAQAQEEFGDRVTIIAIDRAESLETAKKFSDQVGVTSRLVLLLDPDDSFYQAIGGFSMPETIFVAADGTIKDHKRGPMDVEEIKTRIKETLEL